MMATLGECDLFNREHNIKNEYIIEFDILIMLASHSPVFNFKALVQKYSLRILGI